MIKEKQLIQLAKEYKNTRSEFYKRQTRLVDGFNLKEQERGMVAFGIIASAAPELNIYLEIVNSDLIINRLHKKIQNSFLQGSLIILEEIQRQGINIPGYDLHALINHAEENYTEIEDLILGLAGHENMHIIDDKLFCEFPARHYLQKNEDLISLVDSWVRAIEVFDKG